MKKPTGGSRALEPVSAPTAAASDSEEHDVSNVSTCHFRSASGFTVGRGGVHLVAPGEREMSGRFAVGQVSRLFASVDQLDDGPGNVGEFLRGGDPPALEERSRATESVWAGIFSPVAGLLLLPHACRF